MKEDVRFVQAESAAGSLQNLSPEFQARAVERLGIATLVIAGAVVLGFVTRLITIELLGGDPPPWLGAGTVGSCVLLALSLGLYAACRTSGNPTLVLRLGLGYQLLGALCIALPQYAGTHLVHDASGNTISWVGVWILLFPLLVPSALWTQITISVAAASLPPLVFVCWAAWSTSGLPPSSVLFSSFLGHYVCAALAIVPAWLVLRLGRRVTTAQNQARRLGSYQLTHLLGKGGMGEVWRAEHRMLARPAAVKLIKSEALTSTDEAEREAALVRFEREAKTLSQLHSPNTIALFDYGVTDEGTLYYVMELLDGIDLEILVQDFGPLPPGRVIHLLVQACESLAEAHQVGLVHRDVKPANMLICQLGVRHDVLKVLDFGLVGRTKAKRALPESAEVNLTGEGFIVGTPAYMAPEQARGRAVDGQADLYALGCVGYWLLTGQLLFESESAVDLLLHHVRTDPEPPSRRTDHVIPAPLEALLLECLAKEPNDRPHGMLTLRQRLLDLDVPRWTRADADAWWHEHEAALVAHRVAVHTASTATRQPPPLT